MGQMNLLQKEYFYKTSKPADEILKEIVKRKEAQKADKTLFSFPLVNYKSFTVKGKEVEIVRTLSVFDPFRGIGSIVFYFEPVDSVTEIRCRVTPYDKYALLLSSCLILFFLLIFTTIVLIAMRGEILKAALFIFSAWFIPFGGSYVFLKYSRYSLVEYAETVLEDLVPDVQRR